MRRRKKGEIERALFEILSDAHIKPVRFSEIKKQAGARLGPGAKISNKVVFDNLKALEEKGQVERNKAGWRKTQSYSRARARKLLGKIASDALPVNIWYTGHSLTPYFELGYCREISRNLDPPPGLETAARERFRHEIERRFSSMSEGEKNLILGFAARSLWLGYKFFIHHPPPKEQQFKTLRELVIMKKDSEEGKHYLTEYLSQGVINSLGSERCLAEYKMLLLAYALLELLWENPSAMEISTSERVNSKWLSRGRKKIQVFLKEVDKIRFAYTVAVGFRGLHEELSKLTILSPFERWFEALRDGPPAYFIKTELESVKEALNNTADRLEHGLPPKKDVPFPFLGWTPQTLYLNHPRGRDPRFYREIGEVISEALKKKEKTLR